MHACQAATCAHVGRVSASTHIYHLCVCHSPGVRTSSISNGDMLPVQAARPCATSAPFPVTGFAAPCR